jgi:hypothetical protein
MPRGDRRRRLDLHDEIDRAHVDAELEGAVATRRRQLAGLEAIFDDRALLLREGAVVREHELFAGESR